MNKVFCESFLITDKNMRLFFCQLTSLSKSEKSDYYTSIFSCASSSCKVSKFSFSSTKVFTFLRQSLSKFLLFPFLGFWIKKYF